MWHWSLLSGAFPAVLLTLGALGGLFLFVGRNTENWWNRTVPMAVLGAVGTGLAVRWYVDEVWQPFPDPLPDEVTVAVTVTVLAVVLCLASLRHTSWWRRVTAVVATLAVIATGSNAVNVYFGYYPTLAALSGESVVTLAAAPAPQQVFRQLPKGHTVIQDWRAPLGMPPHGMVSMVSIPGSVSKFQARDAQVYFPPAYLTKNRPALPVLLLLSGQPGHPDNFTQSGHLVQTMDAFAAAHHGLAPVVVSADDIGSPDADPGCVDGTRGRVDTYLSVDVPHWITTHLQVDNDTRHWAVGGFSYGGTCSLQLAMNHPRLFPTFLDISGATGPTLGSEQLTIDRLFGGDAAAYHRVVPLEVLQRAMAASPRRPPREFADTFAVLAAGSKDPLSMAAQHRVQAALRSAKIPVQLYVVAGRGHDWYLVTQVLATQFPVIAPRLGL